MKRVLFDENLLPAFEIRTVQEEGWGSIQNGELLRRAVGRFDVFLTADRRMQYQQKLIAFEIGIVVIVTPRSSCRCWSSRSSHSPKRSPVSRRVKSFTFRFFGNHAGALLGGHARG